ncbi:hypothetical protein H072_2965 [Dactylellina haptotyla CBS 200.50]|uniref:ER transporter 6TM N-terminal domain-containing protein n=1 Tax=Dactylellina haptotyla (strain CBS 200.50) TaxID=1284197 RepID=S8AJ95_DACHA|nr:hypothetical protein H072_2965 [Dactylellina haptotyla CBS 200.50]
MSAETSPQAANNATADNTNNDTDNTTTTRHGDSLDKETSRNNSDVTGASPDRVNGADGPARKEKKKKPSKLPDWITERLTARDLKILIRCSLAAWASFLFVVINPVLKNFGQAAFMGLLCLFINPPSTMLPLYLLAATTILLGICLAWGWGTLAYLAAMSRRDDNLYNASIGTIRQQAVQSGTPNLTFYVQRRIFNGELLQTGPTVVMLTMCLVFIYFMARVQAKFPKLTLVSIFGIIVIDPYITTAPLIDNFNGTLPLIFVKPLAASVGIGVVLSLLVFPESCSHATLALLSKSLGRIRLVLDITRDTLQDMGQDIPVKEINKLKVKIVEEHTEIDQGFTFMGLEPSVGRWSGEDIASLKTLFQDLFIRSTVMLNFHLLREEYRSKILNGAPRGDYHTDDESDGHDLEKSQEHLETPAKEHKHGKHHRHNPPSRRVAVTQTLATMTVYEFLRPDPEVAKLGQDALKAVEDVSRNLLAACDDAISAADDIMTSVNNTRWFGRPKKSEVDALVEKHSQVLNNLKHEHEFFSVHAVDKMTDPVRHLFDENGKLMQFTDKEKGVKLPGLMIGINYKHRVLAIATGLIDLLERLVELEMKKTRTRLWLPFALKALFSWALSPEPVRDDNALERTETRREHEERKSRKAKAKKEKKQKGKEARGSHSAEARVGRERGKFAEAITDIFHWFTNNDGVFAARVVLVTLALAIPSILKSSAGFSYDNRAVWALIMAQLTISQYMGDFVFSITMRMFGTVVGGIIGLVVWYIGAGSGPGNPYGIMAILAPFIIFGMAIRVFAPREWMMPGVMGIATMMLIVGYSWESNYLPQLIYAEPGYGVFYRRLLLVIVGFAAAIIVQVFPRPPSATRNASKSLATVLSDLTDFYSDTMSHFLTSHTDADTTPEKLQERIAGLYTQLQELAPRIQMVRFEPSSSPYTSENLSKIADYLGKILESLSIMAFVTSRLTPKYRKRLEVQTDFAKTDTIASIMAVLGVLEGSLRTGHPLAEILPVPLLGKLRKVAGPADGVDSLSREMLKDDEWSTFIVMLMAITSLYSRIDDLVMTVKDAVGEKHYVKGLANRHRHEHEHILDEESR